MAVVNFAVGNALINIELENPILPAEIEFIKIVIGVKKNFFVLFLISILNIILFVAILVRLNGGLNMVLMVRTIIIGMVETILCIQMVGKL